MAMATRVDAHEQTPKEDRAKFASCVEMELDEEKKTSRSHAEMFSATEIMQKQLLHQMLAEQDMGPEWKECLQKKAKKTARKSATHSKKGGKRQTTGTE